MLENRFLKLQEAVDFFSQSLHVEQLMAYGYELIHRSLELKQSALFMIHENEYSLLMQNHYNISVFHERVTPDHKVLAERYGRVLTRDFERYFSAELVEAFNVNIVIPIINKEHLVGFILASDTRFGLLDEEVLGFASTINQLMNKAYEHASAYSVLESKNLELDKRVFNLFFINHSSRILMSELNITQLYSLCVDIIRELTASAITSFFVTDDLSQKMVLRGYKNILAFDQSYDELPYPVAGKLPSKAVYHMATERESIQKIVQDMEPLERLQAEYVIFIVKDKVLGLITISRPVNNSDYDQTVLELIVSIANSIYIAMTNAIQFNEISNQQKLLAAKVQALDSLSRSIKNIQSCQTIDEMVDIIIQTLTYGFGVERCAFLIHNHVQGQHLDAHQNQCMGFNGFEDVPKWLEEVPLKHLEKRIAYTKDQAHHMIHSYGLDENNIGDAYNCQLVLPIEMDIITENGPLRLGTLYIDQLSHPLQPQDEMAFEALVNAAAPYIFWSFQDKKCQYEHMEKPEITIKRLITEAHLTLEKHEIPYWVYVNQISGNLGDWLDRCDLVSGDPQIVILGSYSVMVSHHEQLGDYDLVIKGEDVTQTLNSVLQMTM